MSHMPLPRRAPNPATDIIVVSQEKANLARIRDNQRRSRARRKEYLQELEGRLRQCELQGIEASAEIQLAARRVADENKKLRLLLGQRGVAEENVDAFLQSTAGPESLMGGGAGGLNGLGSMGGNAVQVLESLLSTRKRCCIDGNTGAPESISETAGLQSRDSSAGSLNAAQSAWEATYVNHMRPQTDNMMGGAGKPPQHQFMTPGSTASRTTSVAGTGRGSMSVQQHIQQQQQQQAQQQQQQRSRINSIPSSISSSASPANTTAQQSQPVYDFDGQIALSPTFQRHPSQHNMPTPTQITQNHTQPQQNPSSSHATRYIPTTSNVRATNCLYVTDMITTMAGGEPEAVRSELCGMSNCDPHMDCEVDTQLAFNVMDRYTEQSIGL